MDYKEKYNNALEKLQEALTPKDGCEISGLTRGCIEEIFPELAESKDEKIRNSIIENLKGNMYRADGDYDLLNKQIAWLEKQESVEEIVARCKKSWYNEGRIDGKFEGIADDVKYQQGWHDAVEQGKRLENYDWYEKGRADAIEDTCNWLSQQGDMLEDCFSDINDFVDLYKEAVRGGEKPRGKKVDNANKVEPKFKVGDIMRTLQEAKDGYTDGLPVVVSIDNEYYHCNNELIAIKDQDGYEFPAISIKPKFNIGDWITDGYLHCKISDVLDDRYIVDTKFAKRSAIPFKRENEYHLWTIEDAKDGDILSNGRMVVIFKEFEEPSYREHIVAYIGLDEIGVIQITDGTWELGTDKVNPATKEQRDLLFQKMKEAGYIWDAEKKEPKKIKDEFKNYKQQVMSEMTDVVKDYIRQKPTKWRPSNEQIKALEHFIIGIGESGYASPYDANLKLVYSLLNDLKKIVKL